MGLLEGNEWDSSISVEGYEAKPGENMNPYCNAVSPGYFRTMGITLIAGRDFDEHDAPLCRCDPEYRPFRHPTGSPSSTRATQSITSAIAARSGGTSALARTRGRKTPIEIVGVVRDTKYTGVRDEIPRTVYFAFLENDFAGGAVMYVRTATGPTRRLDPSGRWCTSSTRTSRCSTFARSRTR